MATARLTDAGAPVLRRELVAEIDKRLGVSDIALYQVFNRPQFVRLDGDRVGLLARDVAGGAPATAEAADHAEAVLARRERGLSDHHIHEEVRTLSATHAAWPEPLTNLRVACRRPFPLQHEWFRGPRYLGFDTHAHAARADT